MSRVSLSLLSVVVVACLAGGCVTQTVIKANETAAIQAEQDLAEHELLDVGVALFDPGVPEDYEAMAERNIIPEVREAEARYLPYTLRATLQRTANWGAVRVVPRNTLAVDVMVNGEIVASDGETLAVKVQVQDATGRMWLDKEYNDVASKYSYSELEPGQHVEPFQDLFNQVANDMLVKRESLSGDDLREIRRVSELRFARDLSPYAFAEYLEQRKDGLLQVSRLPAQGDPMLERMDRIREREYLFVDTLDQTYGEFHGEMTPAYDEWRKFSYEEAIALRELEDAAFRRKVLGTAAILAGIAGAVTSEGGYPEAISNVVIFGGASLFRAGMQASKESKMHAAAMRELADSFAADVQPMVVEVEGQTLTLTGSVEEQYEEWRRLLRELYSVETGFEIPELPDEAEIEAGAAAAAEPAH